MTKDIAVLTAALCFVSGVTAHAQTSQLVYSQNFNSAAVDTTGTGLNDGSNIVDNSVTYNARVFDSTQWGTVPSGPTWRSLWLTPMATNISSNFFMPVANSGQYVSSYSANFTLLINYINRTTEPIANGVSINFGKFNNATSVYGSEFGMYSPTNTGNVLSVCFDTYTYDAPAIEARYNGSTIATGAQVPFWNTQSPPPASAFLPVNFSWDSNGLDLTYNGITVFNNLSIPGFAPDIDYSFAMAARTGAAYENLLVDDIAINTTVAPFVWSGGSGNWTTGSNWTINAAPTTNNNWIVMAGSGGNATNNAVTAMQGLVFGSNATGSYTLSGNAVTLGADGLVNSSTSAQTISSAITLNASQTFNAANGGLTLNGTVDTGGNALTIQGANSFTINGAVSGAGGSLTKSGSGTLTLTGSNSYSGGTIISAGRIVGTTSSLQGAITNNAVVEFAQSGNGTYAGVMSGSGSLTKTGAGAVTLSGSNTFSGGAALGAGVLALGSANALGSSGTISFGGGTLQFSASNTTDYSGRFSNAAGQQYSIDTNGQNVTLGSNLTSSGGSFAKSGSGNLILTATSTFTGPASVNAGRLSVNGALGNTAVTVASGAELGGSGSIVGSLAVLSGGTLAPGNSIDSLAGGATSFAAGSTFEYEVNSSLLGSLGTAGDLLVVSGNLDIASGSLFSFTDITSGSVQPFVNETTVFALINYSGIWNGGLFTYGGSPLTNGSTFTVGSQDWRIDYNSSTGGLNYTGDYLPSSNFVTVTAVPEPSIYAMALAGLACGSWSMFRRRKRA